MIFTLRDNISTDSGQWLVEGDPNTLVTYTRGQGEEGEKLEIRGPLDVPLDLGVRNNRRSRWPVVTIGDGSVSFSSSFIFSLIFIIKEPV